MYNLHTHTLLSDGELLPSEIAVRYQAQGYQAIALTDHADYSNIKPLIKATLDFCCKWPKNSGIAVIPGIELTHLPPEQFRPLASLARKKGIKIIVAHGETPAEPVIKGTNQAALLSDIDILAHPGLITDEDTLLAYQKGIFLEITTRKGHKETNQHVINQARKFKAKLILNHDSHSPEDVITPQETLHIAKELGLTEEEIKKIQEDTYSLIKKSQGRLIRDKFF